jgi:tight adherence protein C
MSGAVEGAGLGLLAGVGLAVALSRLPMLRRPTLDQRLAPYLRDSTPPSRLLRNDRTLTPFPTLEHIVAPLMADAVATLERVLGGSASVRRRLDQAGRELTLEEFRAQQVVWAAAGLAAGLAVSPFLAARGGSVVLLLVLCLSGGVAGLLLRDQALSREVARREERIMAEFPTIAELLALAVQAGEGPVGALERVTRISRGDLVFFSSRGGIYHVAIYAGHNRIWHAPYSGTRVRRDKIWSGNVFFGRVR